MKSNTQAFTLIELLVVVMIIGILASVAVPQYQKAVEKSRAMQAMTLTKSLGEAAEAYYLANGKMPSSFDELDIELPGDWTGNTGLYHGYAVTTKSNDKFSAIIEKASDNSIQAIHVGTFTGPYTGTGFSYYFNYTDNRIPTHELLCMEIVRNSDYVFTTSTGKKAGDFCAKLFNGNLTQTGGLRLYTLP